jgi:type I restriction enzyme M protein
MRNLLSPVVNNILGMKKFMLDGDNKSITPHSIYYPPQNITVEDHLDRTLKTVLNVSELLHDEYLAKTTVETHDLLELIEEAQSQLNRPDLFIFEKIDYDYDSFIQPTNSNISELTPAIKINRIDFHVVFSNITQNAIEHGFKNENGNYSIRTYLTVEPGYWILEVTNNGKPLPYGFSTKDIITRGQKSTNSRGLGIGGADIYAIMQKCNGIFELLNESDSEFPVKYILKFPMIDDHD